MTAQQKRELILVLALLAPAVAVLVITRERG